MLMTEKIVWKSEAMLIIICRGKNMSPNCQTSLQSVIIPQFWLMLKSEGQPLRNFSTLPIAVAPTRKQWSIVHHSLVSLFSQSKACGLWQTPNCSLCWTGSTCPLTMGTWTNLSIWDNRLVPKISRSSIALWPRSQMVLICRGPKRCFKSSKRQNKTTFLIWHKNFPFLKKVLVQTYVTLV